MEATVIDTTPEAVERAARRLRRAEPVSPSQPNTYNGCCVFCGQGAIITVRERKPSQAALDEEATEKCTCDGAKRRRVEKRAVERIPLIFGEKSPPVYGGPVEDCLLPFLTEAVLLVATNKLGSMTIKLSDEQSATIKGGYEDVTIIRKRTKQAQSKI